MAKDTIFFWHEYGSPHAHFSQWYHSPFSNPADPSITYLTAEQYMMAQKAWLFKDPGIAAKILETSSPKQQKALGREVKNFDEKVWVENRDRIVEEGNYWKYMNGKDEGELKGGKTLKERLLETGNREIVEASPRDRIWGVGFGEKNAESRRKEWGLNLLGKALMNVRERIRKEEAGDTGRASE